MGYILKPGQSIRRYTPNMGNRGGINGGTHPGIGPKWVGPNIASPQNLTVGVAFSVSVAGKFTGRGGFTWTGIQPAWLNCDPKTGQLYGTPTGAASVSGKVRRTLPGYPIAESNTVAISAT